MFVQKTTIALTFILASATASFAQTPKQIEQFKDWGAYSYNSGSGQVCYVLSIPKKQSPESVDHGDNFFLVSQRPGQNISYEPQAMMGYSLKAGSKVVVTVDGKSFNLFTKGKSAWLENAAEEPALVAAMKAGSSMSVNATSKRGTKTSYDFSLSGITAALKKIESCK